MTAVADTMPGSKRPASVTIADRVKAQLHRDYPPNALSWVSDLTWSGPVSVPAGQIDRKTGDTEWSAAASDKAKLETFRKRIAAGWRKPVVLVRAPGAKLLFAVDGHTRILSCTALGVPVTAYIGTAKTATGPWRKTHSRQLAGDGGAVELSAQTPVLSTVHHPLGSPAGPGLFWVKGLQLPAYIQNIAHALERNGHAESEAIQLAIGACRRWASGAGKVSPEVRSAAAKALAGWEADKATAHSHANDADGIELAGAFNSALHPRVAKGHGNAGQFGSNGTALKTAPGASSGFRPATAAPASTMKPGPIKAPPPGKPAPEPPAEAARIRQLRLQAKKDRQLAGKIMTKVRALIRVRDGYVAGLNTATGAPKAAGKAPAKAVSAKRSAAAKKAAATRKKNGTVRKKAVKSSTKSAAAGKAAATKSANVAKLNGQIHTLRGDAKALLKSANHLDALASSL